MTDMEHITIVIQLIIACITLITLLVSIVMMILHSREARVVRGETLNAVRASQDEMQAISANVRTVEIATNGMKAALIEAAGKAGYAAGVQSERERRKPA